MSAYTEKAMELAERYAIRLETSPAGEYGKSVKEARNALRQHIEQGEPDCRTCEHCYHDDAEVDGIYCGMTQAKCTNWDQYKRADYTPLCEVTNEQ